MCLIKDIPSDLFQDDSALNEKYGKLTVVDNDYFHNSVRFHKFTFEENLNKLLKPVNRTKWSMTPPQVNAYYTPTKNQIVFPAGILQMPFFSLQGCSQQRNGMERSTFGLGI